MQVTDWSIWYTYSTFVTSGRISLPRVIRRALREGLCEAAFTSDARIHWSENGHHSQAHLELDSRGIEFGELVLSVPASLPTFIAPFVNDAAALYMNEQYLFPSLKEHAPPYARFLLPPIWLTFAGRRHCFDLCIKIFENGVMMTQIGHLPRDSFPLSVDEFVFLAEGILHSRASDGLVPNGLMKSVIRYDLSQSSYFWHRVMALCGFSWRRLPTRTVDGHTGYYVEIHESDLFSYDEEPRPLTLRTVASMIEIVAAQLCFTRRHLIRSALWGRSRKAVFVGRYWFGRRDVYMIRYDEQPEAKDSAFIATRADLINSVIGGAPVERLEETIKDLRPHKDYYLFVTEGVTLWICCLKALEQS